jgi:hypothetical protein
MYLVDTNLANNYRASELFFPLLLNAIFEPIKSLKTIQNHHMLKEELNIYITYLLSTKLFVGISSNLYYSINEEL